MRKTTLLLATATLFCSMAFGQTGKIMLDYVEETNIGDYLTNYYYNSDGLVDSLVCSDYYGTTSKSFTYNEQNQIETIDCYSWNGFIFTKYGYIKYGYNEQGQKIWRRNWNYVNNQWAENCDAQISYTYNPDGNLSTAVTYLLVGDKYQLNDSIVYRYSSGRLGRMDCYRGDKALSSYYTYSYSPRGDLNEELNYMTTDGTAASAELYSKRAYSYDRQGNLKEIVYYLANSMGTFNQAQDSTSYIYDTSVSASDIVYPVDPEDTDDYELYLKSKLIGYSIYTLEEYDMTLALTQIYEYNYADFRPLSVNKVPMMDGSDVRVYVTGGTAIVSGIEDKDAPYMIYDMTGRMVRKGNLAGGMVDIYPLLDGYYIMSVNGQSVKFRR